MLRFVVVLALAALVDAKVEYKLVADGLSKVMKYMETNINNYTFDVNSQMAWGESEMEAFILNVKKSPPEVLNQAKDFKTRFAKFTEKAKHNLTVEEKKFFATNFAGHENDFKHKIGRLSDKEPLVQTLDQLLGQYALTSESSKCLFDAMDKNKISPTMRHCEIPCLDKVYDINKKDTGYPVEERVHILTTELMLNCTNHKKEEILQTVTKYCEYLLRQLNVMDKLKTDPKYTIPVEMLYLNKLLTCGTFGYSEFYTDARIEEVLKKIKPDGAIITKDALPILVDILTADVANFLAGTLRFIAETTYV